MQLIMSKRRVPCLDSYFDKVREFLNRNAWLYPLCIATCDPLKSSWKKYSVWVLHCHCAIQFSCKCWQGISCGLLSLLLQLNLVLWPRFKMVIDMHLSSLRTANARTLWEDDVRPHYVTRRYAEFAASLLHLNVNYGDGQVSAELFYDILWCTNGL